MFERFTDASRHALVLAQGAARLLHHNFIGTEHLLLALLHRDQGVLAEVLASQGIALDRRREMAAETDSRLAGAEREFSGLVVDGSRVADEGRGLEDLNSIRARILCWSPAEGQGDLTQTAPMFRSLGAYVRGVLHGEEDCLSGALEQSFKDQWSAPGRPFAAPSYALGGFASYKGGTLDAGAYHDRLRPEHHGAGAG